MRPAIEPGDWILLDPTVRRWPRRGAIVVVREPDTDILALKRVAARPGDPVVHEHSPGAALLLQRDEAWLTGDDPTHSIDSRRYGPVKLDRLVGRAWLRYWPPDRFGLLAGTPRHGTWRRKRVRDPSSGEAIPAKG